MTTKTLKHPNVEPAHPGRLLRADVEAMKVSKVAIAEALGISRRALYDVLDEKHGISPDMAVRLEAVVGSSAEFWLNMQAARDLWAARQRVDVKSLKRIEFEAAE